MDVIDVCFFLKYFIFTYVEDSFLSKNRITEIIDATFIIVIVIINVIVIIIIITISINVILLLQSPTVILDYLIFTISVRFVV